MARYEVLTYHKISNPNGPDRLGDVSLPDNAFSNKNTLAAALRKARILPSGTSLDSVRVEADKIIAFPSNRGGRSTQHSYVLKYLGDDERGSHPSRRNMSGSLNRSPGKKRAKRASKNEKVHAGRVHADRFYDYDELPKKEQAHHDWAKDGGHQFVRMRYGTAAKGRYEYIPMENFQVISGGVTPSGRKADGFAPDSYFSGTAIKMIPQRSGSDHDYQVWMESW